MAAVSALAGWLHVLGAPVRITGECRLEETFGCLQSNVQQQAGPTSKFYQVVQGLFLQINSQQTHDPAQKCCSSEAGDKCPGVRLFLPFFLPNDPRRCWGMPRHWGIPYGGQTGAGAAGSPWAPVSS